MSRKEITEYLKETLINNAGNLEIEGKQGTGKQGLNKMYEGWKKEVGNADTNVQRPEKG